MRKSKEKASSSIKTEWENVEQWYDQIVGSKGHYYHRQVIIPKLLSLLDFKNLPSASLLDLACGQGILSRHIPESIPYTGIDLSPSLIQAAKKRKSKNQAFYVADVCKPLPIKNQKFTHISIILALQNIAHPEQVLKQASKHLDSKGSLVIVLNHPCFRIPRQSHWGIDEKKKLQYRRIDHYLSPLKIPIQMQPGKKESSTSTLSFHHSLSDYSRFLAEAGFSIALLEEWCSDKQSTGKMAKMENRARKEFPLFLTILAQKQ